MQLFRKKYLYNSQKPVYTSQKVKTYQCMNTQTKQQRFLLLQHLSQPPFVQPSPFILQPIQSPTNQQPFSVYPFVQCCSNINKLNEADAMYVLRCLTEAKLKRILYYVLAPQGICVSDVEGLLPQKSPSLFQIAISILDIPESLAEVEKSVVSKDGYEVCRSIKNGNDPSEFFSLYEWKDVKKDKALLTDNEFWIFKGRRKQEGPFGQEYGLAWSSQHNLCRFKYIDLSKVGFEDEFYDDFMKKVGVFQKARENKLDLLQIVKYQKDSKGIKIFSQIPNQGSITDYITTKYTQARALNEKNSLSMLQTFVQMMRTLVSQNSFKSFGNLNIKNIYVHNNKIMIGQPLLITDSVQKKIRQLRNGMDYLAPQLKENILLVENLMKLDFEKMDVWFFGFLLHKMILREVPLFDSTRKPIMSKQKLSPGMIDLISRCVSLTPANRPSWKDINLRELQKQVFLQQVQDQNLAQPKEIKLGTRKERISSRQSITRKKPQPSGSSKKLLHSSLPIEQEFQKLHNNQQQQLPAQQLTIPPTPKFRRYKLILKTLLVMVLYVFVFFRPFLFDSIQLLVLRGYYTTASLHLVSQSDDIMSTATILTSKPEYFMLNNVSFQTLYQELHCISNNFNPIHDPNYQLNSFVQSGSFLALILMGWLVAIIICVTKSISIWKGGIGNSIITKYKQKYWVAYGFFQLSLSALLFAHFYIFQFFYFSIAQPCLGIYTYQGIQPFFDSSLYIFLGNTDQYLRTVFACLGILGLIIAFNTCFYAWGPRLDTKHIFSAFSIILRVVPYVLFILFCRVGIFYVLNPTAINDENKMLQSLVSSSFTGVIGVIPEIFILICVIFELLYEWLFVWVQRKVVESNKLARFFGFKKGKGETISKVSNIQPLNEMSLDNSKHQLVMED